MYIPVVVILSYTGLVQAAVAPTHLMLTRAGPCYDSPGSVVSVSELSLSAQIYDSLVSGELNISENIDNGWKIKATMQKCVDIRNIDSCDFFRSFYLVRDGCGDDDFEEEQYNMLFHYANPKLECPIQAGRYKISNYPLFTEDNHLTVHETKISTSIFGYTFRLDGFTAEYRQIFCVEAYLQLLYIREHSWVQKVQVAVELTTPPTSSDSEEDDHSQQQENE